MTAQFNFRGHKYLSPSFKEAEKFLKFWDTKAKIQEFETTWIITAIERGPGWAPVGIMEDSKFVIEYSDGSRSDDF